MKLRLSKDKQEDQVEANTKINKPTTLSTEPEEEEEEEEEMQLLLLV